ncbi:MAG: hypothetical protein OHK0022_56460 [Roseiflexaceae bacterium]
MFEQVDLTRRLEKPVYRERLPELQRRLYDAEQALLAAQVPALIVFEGWATTAKVETISVLMRKLDPRGLRMHSIAPPRTHELQFPWLHRFWLKTPSYGQVAIFDRSWYRQMLAEYTRGDRSVEQWRARCEDVVAFERQLADDGALILKFWLHISKEEQRRRFDKLLADPLTAWQVTEDDQWQQRHYKIVRAAAEDMIARTDTPHAPWRVMPATDRRYMRIALLETILAAVEERLGSITRLQPSQQDDRFDAASPAFLRRAAGQANGVAPLRLLDGADGTPATATAPSMLRRADLSQALPPADYEEQLARLQARMYLLGLQIYRQQRPVVLVFEGWDAAGKGGAIQRLTAKLDPRAYVVHAIAAPSGEDREHHYLYRFWRRLPPRGMLAIFDRSWYGRVLVERVEGFARPDEWQRAYAEINEFERQLVDFGTLICKFWLHISPDEQLRRFHERQTVPYKAWKLTDEDWRNREKWPHYERAADDMLLHTSTPAAPWTIVEAEDKRFARIKVLRTVMARLEAELGKVKLGTGA